MKERRTPDPSFDALPHRLLWYGTAAGAALAAATEADGQVLATELDPPFVAEYPADYDLDFDGDGDPELRFGANAEFPIALVEPDYAGDAMGAFIGTMYCEATPAYCASQAPWLTYAYWLHLDPGVTVGPDAPSLVPTGSLYAFRPFVYFTNSGGYDPFGWRGAGPSFVGLEVALDDGPHYGWVALVIPPEGGEIHLRGYAYEATPGVPITAGDVGTAAPLVTLDGSVNQTTFPPEGGTLAFTATVTNTTPEPDTLDVWMVTRRNGEIVGDSLLGAVEVPGGAAVTETFEAEVQAELPPDTYDVRFHVGRRFPAVMDSEAFTIIKVPATGIDGAGEGLEGTHVFGAPSPNPSAGWTTIPLSVATMQYVRVTVYDALGREVAVLHEGPLAGGVEHRLAFGSALARGVYVVRAVGETFADTRAVTLIR